MIPQEIHEKVLGFLGNFNEIWNMKKTKRSKQNVELNTFLSNLVLKKTEDHDSRKCLSLI